MAGVMNCDQINNSAGNGAVLFPNGITTPSFVAPTQQRFTSSTGTYTTPTSPRSPLYLRVRMVGGGGGGGGSSTYYDLWELSSDRQWRYRGRLGRRWRRIRRISYHWSGCFWYSSLRRFRECRTSEYY